MTKKRNIIAAAAMGLMMTFTVFNGTAYAETWTCPYGHEYCPGESSCEEHRQCVENGYCSHDYCENGVHGDNCVNKNCRTGSTSTTSRSTSYGSCHSGSGHHGGRGRHHR